MGKKRVMLSLDKDLETVLPKTVSKAYCTSRNSNRTIIHYMQPHTPYLLLNTRKRWAARRSPDFMKKRRWNENKLLQVVRKKYDLTREQMENAIGSENLWKLLKVLKFPFIGPYEEAWRVNGLEGIYYCYEDNLRRVLTSVF